MNKLSIEFSIGSRSGINMPWADVFVFHQHGSYIQFAMETVQLKRSAWNLRNLVGTWDWTVFSTNLFNNVHSGQRGKEISCHSTIFSDRCFFWLLRTDPSWSREQTDCKMCKKKAGIRQNITDELSPVSTSYGAFENHIKEQSRRKTVGKVRTRKRDNMRCILCYRWLVRIRWFFDDLILRCFDMYQKSRHGYNCKYYDHYSVSLISNFLA